MDITCNKCGMEYSLDDTLISGAGTSVRCMNCNQVFKVYKTSRRGPDEWLLRQAHGPFRTIDNLGLLQQWIQEGKISPDDLLSQKNGPWKKVGDIEQLKPFFEMAKRNPAPSEGRAKIEKSEHLSTIRRKPRQEVGLDVTERFAALKETPVADQRGQKSPQPLGAAPSRVSPKRVENEKPTLPPPPVTADHSTGEHSTGEHSAGDHSAGAAQWEDEITRTFNRPEQVFPPKKPAPQAAAKETPTAPSTRAQTEAPDFSSIPTAKEDVAWSGENAEVSEPAWTEKASGGLPRYEATMDAMPPAARGHSKWILLAVAVIGMGAAALFLFWPDKKDDLLSSVGDMVSTPEQTRFQKFFDRGRENFLLDTGASFLQADREFQKVLALKESHPPTLAALARLYAVWAQYIRDAKLDMAADKPAKGGSGAEGKETALLSQEFEQKLQEAAQWSRQALAADPHLKETLLAAADVARLSGNREEAEAKLAQATSESTDAQTEYVAVLIAVDEGTSPKDAALRLQNIVDDHPMIRALYRLARIQASYGDTDSAKATLAKLFALNSNHPQAKDLAARIDAEKKIALIDTPLSTKTVASGTVDSAPAANATTTAPAETVQTAADDDAASTKTPQGIPATLKRAAALQSNGQPAAAKALYQSVLEREPSNLDALTGVGYCYLDSRETGRALASFRRALAIKSSHGPALIGTAETYKSMGQKDEALKFYRSYVAAVPSGRQADMARKNIARFEAEQEAASAETPKHHGGDGDDDEIVIDDSPPAAQPVIEEKAAPPPEDTPNTETPDAPPSGTIIIMKKDDPAPSEE